MSTVFAPYLTELQVLRDVSWSTVLIALVAIPAIALIIDYGRILFLRQRMPPGPFPWPIFGNVFQFPKEKPWYKFEEWSQKYNDPVITVWIGRSPTVVLNDAWTASELMDKRANIYSSRPRLPVPGIVMGGESWAQTMLPYGDQWRRQRKLTVRPHVSFAN
jgi:Cytochrome P450